MKTLIAVVLSLLVASKASAEVVPAGCYKVQGDDNCFEAADGNFLFVSPDAWSQDKLIVAYGEVVTSLLFKVTEEQRQIKKLSKTNRKLKLEIKRGRR